MVIKHGAILIKIGMALKRVEGNEARVTLLLPDTDLLPELMQIHNVSDEDLLVALLNGKVPGEPPERTGEVACDVLDLIIVYVEP